MSNPINNWTMWLSADATPRNQAPLEPLGDDVTWVDPTADSNSDSDGFVPIMTSVPTTAIEAPVIMNDYEQPEEVDEELTDDEPGMPPSIEIVDDNSPEASSEPTSDSDSGHSKLSEGESSSPEDRLDIESPVKSPVKHVTFELPPKEPTPTPTPQAKPERLCVTPKGLPVAPPKKKRKAPPPIYIKPIRTHICGSCTKTFDCCGYIGIPGRTPVICRCTSMRHIQVGKTKSPTLPSGGKRSHPRRDGSGNNLRLCELYLCGSKCHLKSLKEP